MADGRKATFAASFPWKKPSTAFFHLGNTRKRRRFSGLPYAASCGGRLYLPTVC